MTLSIWKSDIAIATQRLNVFPKVSWLEASRVAEVTIPVLLRPIGHRLLANRFYHSALPDKDAIASG